MTVYPESLYASVQPREPSIPYDCLTDSQKLNWWKERVM